MGYKQYCKNPEKIENYEAALADNFKGWECHHRLETHNSDGERRLVDITKKELRALGMYYGRPAEELIFLRKGEHTALHSSGKHHSEESKKKNSEAHKGKHLSEEAKKKLSEANKGHPVSEETKKKMSEAKKNISEETKKKLSKARKGMHWFNNGKENKLCFECPDGFVPGRLR